MRYVLRIHPAFGEETEDLVREQSKEILVNYGQELIEQGLMEQTVHDINIEDAEHFYNMTQDPYKMTFTLHDAEKDFYTAGHLFLNGFYGKCAQAHFGLVGEYRTGLHPWRAMREAMRQMFVFERRTPSGKTESLVEQLVGITPISQVRVVRFLEKQGWDPIMTLKDTCYKAATDTYEDGILTILRRRAVENYDGKRAA